MMHNTAKLSLKSFIYKTQYDRKMSVTQYIFTNEALKTMAFAIVGCYALGVNYYTHVFAVWLVYIFYIYKKNPLRVKDKIAKIEIIAFFAKQKKRAQIQRKQLSNAKAFHDLLFN